MSASDATAEFRNNRVVLIEARLHHFSIHIDKSHVKSRDPPMVSKSTDAT